MSSSTSATAVIVVAMESERRQLDHIMPGWEIVDDDIWVSMKNGEVVTITCGIGMVAAAAATQHAIERWQPKMVLNFGCAGAHRRDVFPGDVVIGNEVVHQGRMRFAPDGRMHHLSIPFTVPGETEPLASLHCDESLRTSAEIIAKSLVLPTWPDELRLVGQSEDHPQVMTGTVASGDMWLQNPTLIDRAHKRFTSLCEDMEAAAIAQVCALHHLPFLTVKDVSNSEFHEATVFEGSSSALPNDEVGLRSAMIVAELLKSFESLGKTRWMPQS